MDRRILCDSLIQWIKTLNLNQTIHGVGDFSDGVLIGICLQNIDANHFDENWLSKIRTDIAENTRLKENNLKKILKTLIDYYSEVLGQSLIDFRMPDLNLIAENFDETELSRLLQLVLGCAVSCDRKQFYIERIMSLEASVQHVLMNAIQELMIKENRKHTDEFSEMAIQLKNALEELNRVVEGKEEIENRCRELDLQIVTLQDEKMNLIEQTNELNQRLQQYENAQENDSQNRFQTLQQRNEIQQEEIFRLETALQDYRSKFEILREENDNLLKQNDNLMVLAGDARSFKDELDILRNKCEKMTKLESTIEAYKIKLEEMSNLRQQIKYLEETNLRLFDEKSQLEQECKQIKLLQTQIEFHKKTNQDLYQKFHELQRSTEKVEFERNRLEDKLNTINAEKINLNEEIELLKQTNQQLKTEDIDEVVEETDSQVQSPNSFEGFNFINVPIEIRERFLRLQHENQLLKSQQNNETNSEQISLLQANCEQLKDQNHQLTNDLWTANQKILELEATLKETSSSNEVADLKISLNRTTNRHEEESIRTKNQIDELEKRLENTERQLNERDELLSKKTTEINAMEERYVQYLEKAKMVLRQLDPRGSPSMNNQEIQSLKKQIDDRDRKIKDIQKEYEKMKAIKEDQEKLLVSAWYSLGSSFQRHEYEERLKAHQSQSFLSKQRHIPSSHKQPPHDPSKN